MPDAQLTIDKEQWEKMTDGQRAGLVDHELHHLIVEIDSETDTAKLDPQGRPVLSMREHDVEVGWFLAVAERHQQDSPEQTQAREIFEKHGKVLFPFVEMKQGELPL